MIHETGISVTSDTENPALTDLRKRVEGSWDDLSRAERAVCRALTSTSAELLLYATAADLGAKSGTSNATVVRTLQSLGYTGLSAFKQHLAGAVISSMAPNERLELRLDHLSGDVGRIQDEVWAEAQALIELGASANSQEKIAEAAQMLVNSPRVHCYGLGVSRSTADYLALRLQRAGVPSTLLDSDGFRLADQLLAVRPGDVVVIIVPRRQTKDIDAIITHAREVGASLLLITDGFDLKLNSESAIVLHAPLTPTGLVSETLCAMLIVDALVQTIASVTPNEALRTSHALTALRSLLGY